MKKTFVGLLCISTISICVVFLNYNLHIATNEKTKVYSYQRENELEDYETKEIVKNEEIERKNVESDFFQRVIYNRVGKCGSRSMLQIVQTLAKQHNFVFYSSPISNRTRPPILEIKKELGIIDSLSPPMLYSRHIHYLNFQKFGMRAPIYINMVRDPIERFVSQYYFKRFGDGIKAVGRHADKWRKGEKEMNINDCILFNQTECVGSKLWYIVPYFCGQEPICKRPSRDGLNRAKLHLLDNYLAVGVLEDFEGTLEVFEKLLPYHFSGALAIWGKSHSSSNKTSTLGKEKISPEAYEVLRKRMALDYEFYNFVLKRFGILKDQLGIN